MWTGWRSRMWTAFIAFIAFIVVFATAAAPSVAAEAAEAAERMPPGSPPIRAICVKQPGDDLVRYDGTAWTRIGARVDRVYAAGLGTFATFLGLDGLYRYSGTPGAWTRIGPAAEQVVVTVTRLYARYPDGIYRYDSGETWVRIGEPAAAIYGGASSDLVAVSADGDLLRYTEPNWLTIGSGGGTVAISFAGVFRLTPVGTVERLYTYPDGWQELGGPAESIAIGSYNHPVVWNAGKVWRVSNTAWTSLGSTSGSALAVTDDAVFSAGPAGIERYDAASGSWTAVGGASLGIAACR